MKRVNVRRTVYQSKTGQEFDNAPACIRAELEDFCQSERTGPPQQWEGASRQEIAQWLFDNRTAVLAILEQERKGASDEGDG